MNIWEKLWDKLFDGFQDFITSNAVESISEINFQDGFVTRKMVEINSAGQNSKPNWTKSNRTSVPQLIETFSFFQLVSIKPVM